MDLEKIILALTKDDVLEVFPEYRDDVETLDKLWNLTITQHLFHLGRD